MIDREILGFDPKLYFYYGNPKSVEEKGWISTEIYYQALDFQEIRGTLTLKYDHMCFNSVLNDLTFKIDYLDIVSVNKFPFGNAEADKSKDEFIQMNYMKKWML